MRVFCFSDLHFHKGRNDYLLETCRWLAGQIVEQQPNLVVCCGDLAHTHGYLDTETLDAMMRGVREILVAAGKVDAATAFVAGNHDQASRDAAECALAPIRDLTDATVATTEPCSFVIESGVQSCRFVLAPYPSASTAARKHYFERLHAMVGHDDHVDDCPILLGGACECRAVMDVAAVFTHWELEGIPYRPQDDFVKNSSHAVTKRDLSMSRLPLIVNGHYHHPVTYDGKLIVGSPCYHNYADTMTAEPRGAVVLDLDPELPPFEATYPWRIARLENPHGPIYHTIDQVLVVPETMAELDRYADRLKLRVKCTADPCESEKSEIKNLQERGATVRLVGESTVQVGELAIPAGPDLDLERVLSDYIEQSPTKLDRARLLALGRRLVESAQCDSSPPS